MGDSERRILALASTVLECDVQPTANFFELGGDSLAAVQLVELVGAELGVEVPLEMFFDASDFGAFAAVVDALA